MDFGTTPRIAPAGPTGIVPRSDIVAATGSVAVDLAPEKTVQSAQAGDAVRVDIRRPDRRDAQQDAAKQRRDETEPRQERTPRNADPRSIDLKDVIERRLVIEPSTRTVVLQKRNVETGETVQTLPDEATLKLRLYSREITERARLAEDVTARYVERTA